MWIRSLSLSTILPRPLPYAPRGRSGKSGPNPSFKCGSRTRTPTTTPYGTGRLSEVWNHDGATRTDAAEVCPALRRAHQGVGTVRREGGLEGLVGVRPCGDPFLHRVQEGEDVMTGDAVSDPSRFR